MNNNYYKVLQVINILIEKYNFIQISLKDYESFNSVEAWLRNENDPNFSLIRVTCKGASSSQYDNNRIEDYLDYFKCHRDNFLDIHISNDEYDKQLEVYNYLNLEDAYASGHNVFNIYPEIYACVRNVDDIDKEYDDLVKNKNRILLQRFNERFKINKSKPIITYIIIALCALLYILKMVLSVKYSSTIVDIALGANYNTFTVGLKQVYRLITSAFLHGSFLHLFSNVYSLYVLGSFIESYYGHLKYCFILFSSILLGSLSQIIFNSNSVSIGLSGGLYGLMLVFIIDLVIKGRRPITSFLPLIFVNLSINFIANIAWMAHLGGMIGGYLAYVCINSERKKDMIILYVLFMIFVLFKFFTIDKINPFYKTSDMEVIKLYNDIGLKKYCDNLLIRLAKVYSKFGG